jgi:hypothetical protein
MNNDKPLYLKALCKSKGNKKVTKEIAEAIRHFQKKGTFDYSYKADRKPLNPKEDQLEGKKFILEFAEDFLGHAVDYSLDDKIEGVLGLQK